MDYNNWNQILNKSAHPAGKPRSLQAHEGEGQGWVLSDQYFREKDGLEDKMDHLCVQLSKPPVCPFHTLPTPGESSRSPGRRLPPSTFQMKLPHEPRAPRPAFILVHGKWSTRCFPEDGGAARLMSWLAGTLTQCLQNNVMWIRTPASLKETLPSLGRGPTSMWNYSGNGFRARFQTGEGNLRCQKTGVNTRLSLQEQDPHQQASSCSSSQVFTTMNSSKQTTTVF